MTVSITTVCLNAERKIGDCLQSVSVQTLAPDEFIVIDGKSVDRTHDIVSGFVDLGIVSTFISERDRGISHAFNKAWQLSKCDYVANINSDDVLPKNYLKVISEEIKKSQPDIIICQLGFKARSGIRYIKPRIFLNFPVNRWFNVAINHPGMVIRREMLERVGGYDENYKYAMDVDLFFKLQRLNPRVSILNNVYVFQSDGGISQQEWVGALKEMRLIEINHGRPSFEATAAFVFRVTKSFFRRIIFELLP